MIKQIFLFLSLLISIPSFAQWGNENTGTLSSGKDAQIQWEKKIIDLGKIKQFNPKETTFSFKNTGGKPIVITNAKGSCGCTDIEYPKSPILPGKDAIVLVTYDAEMLGVFNKTITLTMNIENSTQVLHLKGTVIE